MIEVTFKNLSDATGAAEELRKQHGRRVRVSLHLGDPDPVVRVEVCPPEKGYGALDDECVAAFVRGLLIGWRRAAEGPT